MKNKKIFLSLFIFLAVLFILNVKSNAYSEIKSQDDLKFFLGKENVEEIDDTLVLQKDIVLKDGVIFRDGVYKIDLNGKKITYRKDYATLFYIYGGNITLKDSAGNGEICPEKYNQIFSCHKGTLRIESGKYRSLHGDIIVGVSEKGIVQIDGGEFISPYYECISTGTGGVLLINDGRFVGGVQVDFAPFDERCTQVRINGGTFEGHYAGIYVWSDKYLEDFKLRGGYFKGIDDDANGIIVRGSSIFDFKNILDRGYKFDNEYKEVEEYKYSDSVVYITKSAKEFNVVKDENNSIDSHTVVFVDKDENLLKTVDYVKGEEVIPPEAPEIDGYVFTRWDKDYENTDSDIIVFPVYDKIYKLYIEYVYPCYYNGENLIPDIAVRDSESKELLTLGTDYEITCSNNVNVGIGNIEVTPIGKYKYDTIKSGEFTILPKYIYSNANGDLKIEGIKNYTYTGNEIKPELKITYKDMLLEENKDYRLKYSNNINAGFARIEIEGIGNFAGTTFTGFTINKKELKEKDIYMDLSDKVFEGKNIEPEAYAKDGDKMLTKGVDYTIAYRNNHIYGKASIVLNGIGNYEGKFEKEFNIVKKQEVVIEPEKPNEPVQPTQPEEVKKINISSISKIQIDTSNKSYTGSEIKTNISLKNNGKTLKEGTDFTVKYSNNKKVGVAKVTITGIGKYEGTITKTFKITPKKMTIKSLKNTILRCVTIKWNKDSNVKGYEIFRATSKDGNYNLVKKVSNSSITSAIFLAQKKGTYYYKIRSYTVVNGETIYSEFSDIQTVTVKR